MRNWIGAHLSGVDEEACRLLAACYKPLAGGRGQFRAWFWWVWAIEAQVRKVKRTGKNLQ